MKKTCSIVGVLFLLAVVGIGLLYYFKPETLKKFSRFVDNAAPEVKVEDFRLDNVRERVTRLGDLWKPLLAKRGRFEFSKLAA